MEGTHNVEVVSLTIHEFYLRNCSTDLIEVSY